MAANFSIQISQRTVVGNLRMIFGTITGGSSDYVNGAGYALTAAKLGLNSLLFFSTNSDSNGLDASISTSANTATLKAFWPTNATPSEGAGVEVTTATDLSGSVWPFVAFGV